MQSSQHRFIQLPAASERRQLRILSSAFFVASLLPNCSVPSAKAGTVEEQAPKNHQRLASFTASAPCHTAPARNVQRKLSAVAGLRKSANGLYYSRVLKSTGTDFGPAILYSQSDGGFSVTDRWTGGDFDGDGDQDLIAVWNNGGNTAFAFRQSIGDNFFTSQLPIALRTWNPNTVWIPGDFDNNGRSDLAAIFPDGSMTSIDVYLSTSSGFSTPQRFMTQQLPWNATTKWSIGDFDGGADKRDDLVSVRDNGGVSAAVWISNGSAFTGTVWSTQGGWSEYTKYVAGDFTGDGKADLAGVWDNGGATSIAVYPSLGNTFASPGQWRDTNLSFYRTGHAVAGHFTNDNRADIVLDWDYDYTSTFLAYTSTGTSFDTTPLLGVTGDYWNSQSSICSGVFNATL